MPVQHVATAEARVDRPLELRVLLRDRFPENLPEGDAESLEGSERLHYCDPPVRFVGTP